MCLVQVRDSQEWAPKGTPCRKERVDASHRLHDLISPSPTPSTSGQVLGPSHMQVCCIFPAMGLAPCSTAIYFSVGTLW